MNKLEKYSIDQIVSFTLDSISDKYYRRTLFPNTIKDIASRLTFNFNPSCSKYQAKLATGV